MRDVVLTAIILGLLPAIFARPYVGIYVFHWLSLMNPHRLAYGFAHNFPFAQIVAVSTLGAWLFSREPKRIPWQAPTMFLVAFWIWTCLTTLLALAPALAYDKWEQTTKILLMAFFTLAFLTDRRRLDILVWVAAASLGYFGVKGGLFALATGGHYRLWGPTDSFIGDNNAIALALVMLLPLLRYLMATANNRWLKRGLLGAFILTVIAVVTTYSRGGLVGLLVVMVAMWMRSRHRLAIAVVTAAALSITLPLLPTEWFERMQSIQDYHEDNSAQSRLQMWGMALAIAIDHPVIGGGFHVFKEPSLYPQYNAGAAKVRDVHSIYFEVLGEHGFVGLALFLSLGLATLTSGGWIRRKARGDPDLAWARELAAMLQVSIIGYAASGTFLTLASFDFYYLLIAMMVALRAIVVAALKKPRAVDQHLALDHPGAGAMALR
jgi:probable O-glycosylation ligase (exosortase A-associated)